MAIPPMLILGKKALLLGIKYGPVVVSTAKEYGPAAVDAYKKHGLKEPLAMARHVHRNRGMTTPDTVGSGAEEAKAEAKEPVKPTKGKRQVLKA